MRRSALLSMLVVLALPAASLAQETRVGLGLGLQSTGVPIDDDFGVLTLIMPVVYVPIDLGGSIVVEPGLGFMRLHEEVDSDFGSMEGTFSILRLGAGVLFVHAAPERGRLYVGPRIGITRLSSEVEFDGGGSEDQTRTDLSLAGVAGGEFFLMPAFSLGGEVGLNYTRAGDDGDDDDGTDTSISVLGFTSEFRVRWYY